MTSLGLIVVTVFIGLIAIAGGAAYQFPPAMASVVVGFGLLGLAIVMVLGNIASKRN